jgi:hypothetical protein
MKFGCSTPLSQLTATLKECKYFLMIKRRKMKECREYPEKIFEI